MAAKPAHVWRPIELPADVGQLARSELRALERLWTSSRQDLEKSGAWQPFWERMSRWWAIETGVIEGIFDVSLGVTRSLVEQGLLASLIPHGESNRPAQEVIEILGDHREALDMVLDVVSGARSLTTSWIKEIHALICRHQDTTDGEDQFGQRIRIPLPRGEYKRRPNSVVLPSGERHEYCPPEHVAAEMDRLIALYHQIPEDLPEVRSAWLHHAFTQIHPFEDGNGRVARALASIDFIRARLFPLVIERQQRDTEYIPALIAADKGDLAPLVALFAARQERAVRKAISEADAVAEHVMTLDAALDAAQKKLSRRSAAAEHARKASVSRLPALAQLAASQLEATRQQVANKKLLGVKAVVQRPDGQTARYWREQIVREARRGDYWADLHEPWEWVSLRLTNGGVTNFVVVLHFVGNPSPGSAAAIGFLVHRPTGGGQPLLDAPHLTVEPLMLYPEESAEPQRRRFIDWLARATSEAIAVWTRYL